MVDKDFAQRLARACDDSKIVPEYGKGRQVYIAKKLKVTQEAVRRWFTGDSRPRVKIMDKLADLLEKDVAWLSLGIEPDMDRSEKKFFDRHSEGVVYLALGLAMMDGAAVAVPDEKDPNKGFVDYYAIYQGVQAAVHCSLGREISDSVWELSVPHEFTRVKSIGYIFKAHRHLHVIDLAQHLVQKHKKSKGGGYVVTVSAHGSEYITGRDKWPRIARLTEEFS